MTAQGDMFAGYRDPRLPADGIYRADPARIRKRFAALLARLNAGDFDFGDQASRATLHTWQAITPNMTRWLPADEAEAVTKELMPRIEALLA